MNIIFLNALYNDQVADDIIIKINKKKKKNVDDILIIHFIVSVYVV